MKRNAVLILAFGLTGLCGCGFVGSPCTPLTENNDCPANAFCKVTGGSCSELAVGVCTAIPEVCTLEYAPVCGCDGVTYGNKCGADGAGANISGDGECNGIVVHECGGLLGLPCDEGEFCSFADGTCGAADQTGACIAFPELCAEIYAPVCGCDGESYGNRCEANLAGVSIVSEGECDSVEDRHCGGLLGLPCDEGEFCNFELDALCGAADQTGVCEVIPEVCAEIFAPVCGCDDQTYDNECSANAAGVSVVSEGECNAIVVRECGGLQGLPCEAGEFCNFTDGSCGAADQLGICEVIPDACDAVFDPVCGCDDQTYSNDCEAAAAGVSVVSEGACPQ